MRLASALGVALALVACGGDEFTPGAGGGGSSSSSGISASGGAGDGGSGGGEVVGDCAKPADCADKPGTSCVEGKCTCPSASPDYCPPEGCIDKSTSIEHCGQCGNACSGGDQATPVCEDGQCALACESGFLDCDQAVDGCETKVGADPANCGGCGVVCALGECAEGKCDDPVEVSAGQDFACARRQAGSVWCWGANNWGQVGSGSNAGYHTLPVEVGLSSPAVSLRSRGTSSCALLADGSVVCWGNTNSGKTTVTVQGLGTIIDLSVGGVDTSVGQSCAVLQGGTVKCWTVGFTDPTASMVNIDAKAVAAGGNHLCVVKNNGALACSGDNSEAQLGLGDKNPVGTPTIVPSVVADHVAAGGLHTCVISPQKELACWGDNQFGQVGNGSFTDGLSPSPVAMPAAVDAVFLGRHHSAALVGGDLWLWGKNGYHQVNDAVDMNVSSPLKSSIPDVANAALGDGHTCVVDTHGHVLCWGQGTFGQLGDGNGADSETPVAVEWN